MENENKLADKPIVVRKRKRRMHPKDIVVLRMVKNHGSIQEIVKELNVHSTNSVHRRLKILERAGLINPPPHPRMARSRTLTEIGEGMLQAYDTAKAEVIPGVAVPTEG